MSKAKFSAQAEKLKNLVDSARLQTSSSAVTATAPSQPNEGAEEVSGRPVAARTKAKNLKAIREYKKLSQSEVAERCAMSDRRYGEIERGEANFTLETRVKLCVGLGITPYELFGDLVIEPASSDD